MNDQELAKQIVKHVGGKENISQVRHCATRLRLIVRNKDLIETDQVENLDDVKGSLLQLRPVSDYYFRHGLGQPCLR